MDAGLNRALGLTLLMLAANVARADLYLCVDGAGHRLIQDKPCKAGERTDAHARERGKSSVAAPATKARGTTPAAAPSEAGLRRNKTVICQLLDAEKRDTEAQIRGETAAPAGENPQDNLVKIERQRARVGCDAAG